MCVKTPLVTFHFLMYIEYSLKYTLFSRFENYSHEGIIRYWIMLRVVHKQQKLERLPEGPK